jgi:hypothetical protein
MTQSRAQVQLPPLLRFLLWLGRPFGLMFVPEHHAQVVYRMGRYGDARGPGMIRYNRLTETLGPMVNTGGQMKEMAFTGLITRDALPVGVRLSVTLAYDPRLGPDLASVLTRVPREAYEGIARTFVQWALLGAVNRYNADEIARNEVRAQVEAELAEKLASEMGFLGLQARRVRILQVEPPASLAERHALIAQRRASILAGGEFNETEMRRALVTEVIENLGRSAGAESFVNFTEMLEAYAAERPAQPAARVIEQPPRQAKPRSRL